jgi:hypothetical protein
MSMPISDPVTQLPSSIGGTFGGRSDDTDDVVSLCLLRLTRAILAPTRSIDCGDALPQFRPESSVECHDSSSTLVDEGK